MSRIIIGPCDFNIQMSLVSIRNPNSLSGYKLACLILFGLAMAQAVVAGLSPRRLGFDTGQPVWDL